MHGPHSPTHQNYKVLLEQGRVSDVFRPQHIEYFKTRFISFYETADRNSTVLLTVYCLVPSPSTLQLVAIPISPEHI